MDWLRRLLCAIRLSVMVENPTNIRVVLLLTATDNGHDVQAFLELLAHEDVQRCCCSGGDEYDFTCSSES
jgi:hypothetical protein